MGTARANGIDIEYDTFGDPKDPALLLVMGFTAQLISWDEGFVQRLADGGRYVIRYDNRDVGKSTWFDDQEVDVAAVLGAAMTGGPMPAVPYTLSDMAADGIGLLDHLGIEKAHIMGASMGGMIVQTMAIEHPERVLSLISVMSTTGEPEYGQATPEAMQALLAPPPEDRAAFIEAAASNWKIFASPRYFDADVTRERAAAGYDRAFHPAGASRQLAAMLASGSRADGLRALDVPTLVLHGRADALITWSGGDRTAELVPGATLMLLNDMGHDFPEPLWPELVAAILSHTGRAGA